MTRPGLPANSLPPDFGSFMRRLQTLEREFKMMQGARTLENATVGAGGIRSADFDGDLETGTTGTTGWGLSGSTGGAIFNSVTLRDGIIGNDALTDPVVPASFFTDASGVTLSTTSTGYARSTITVPAGFTRAVVIAHGAAQLSSPGAAVTLSCQLQSSASSVIGTPGPSVGSGGIVSVGASSFGQASDALSQVADLTGLSSFYLEAYVQVSAAVAAYSGDVVVSGAVIFLR